MDPSAGTRVRLRYQNAWSKAAPKEDTPYRHRRGLIGQCLCRTDQIPHSLVVRRLVIGTSVIFITSIVETSHGSGDFELAWMQSMNPDDPPSCPHCGSPRVVRFVYGRPNGEGFKAIQGGPTPNSPLWRRGECGLEGGRLRDTFPADLQERIAEGEREAAAGARLELAQLQNIHPLSGPVLSQPPLTLGDRVGWSSGST